VPKILGQLKTKNNKNKIIVSFKLETDLDILESKVVRSFEKYGVDYVVANVLDQVRYKVWFYTND